MIRPVSALFRSASTSSFDKLYRQHAASVYRYLRAVLGNHADAEDVTQQVFLKAYRALEQGTKPRKAENWLFTIAHNEVRRHLRDTRGRRLEVELDEEVARPDPERSGPSVTDVLRALQQLTPNQRSALVMREFEGRSYAEIAGIIGVSQSALETLVFRARRALAEALEDGLTCEEAELALSRRLDGRLSRREGRRLKAHMRECRLCSGFDLRQKRQQSLLRGLSVIPIPASLFAFRGEQAAAAVGGLTTGAAATGGSVGVAAKAAAVVAAVTVAGGVGYTARSELPVTRDRPPAVAQAASAPTRARATGVPVVQAAEAATPPAKAKPTGKAARVESRRSTKPKKATPARADRGAVEVPTDALAPERPSLGRLKPKSEKADKPKKRGTPAAPRAKARVPVKRAQPARPEPAARGKQTKPAPAVSPGRQNQPLDPKPSKAEEQLLDPKPAKPEQAKP